MTEKEIERILKAEKTFNILYPFFSESEKKDYKPGTKNYYEFILFLYNDDIEKEKYIKEICSHDIKK